jgi:hypothetical protein
MTVLSRATPTEGGLRTAGAPKGPAEPDRSPLSTLDTARDDRDERHPRARSRCEATMVRRATVFLHRLRQVRVGRSRP